jgi:SAM-dependent methyltransferase
VRGILDASVISCERELSTIYAETKTMTPSALERAEKFRWASVIGQLHPERISHLERYVCGTRVLDVGCGGGGYVEHLAQKDLSVVGVDRDKELLCASGARPRGGTYFQGDAGALPFLDKSFDCAYCFDVLEHVDDLTAIRELARVTRSRLIVTVPKEDEEVSGFGLTFFHYQDKTHLRNYTEDSLRALVSNLPASRIRIFPELPIPMKHFVRAMIKGADATAISRKVPHRLLARLLACVPYRSVYTGLVAVVDL